LSDPGKSSARPGVVGVNVALVARGRVADVSAGEFPGALLPRSRLFLVGKFRAKLSSYRLEVEAIRGERFVAAQPEAVAPALAGIFDAHEGQVNAGAAALPGLTERAPIVDWPRVLFVLGVVAVIAAWWAGLGYGAWLALS